MSAKNVAQSRVLVVVVNGFEETETVAMITILRQAGLCVKSVGLTSGLVASAHGPPPGAIISFRDFRKVKCNSNSHCIRNILLKTFERSRSHHEYQKRNINRSRSNRPTPG